MRPAYLDYNATTPVDPAVLEAMLPYLATEFGNPSSALAPGVQTPSPGTARTVARAHTSNRRPGTHQPARGLARRSVASQDSDIAHMRVQVMQAARTTAVR